MKLVAKARKALISATAIATYWQHPSLALSEINDRLVQAGIRVDSEPGWSMTAESDRASLPLVVVDPDGEVVAEIDNSLLVVSWYRMPSGNYEVIAYLS